jgi:hypothetical protein
MNTPPESPRNNFDQLVAEMLRYLPVLQRLRDMPEAWQECTEGTGVDNLDGYAYALARAGARRGA